MSVFCCFFVTASNFSAWTTAARGASHASVMILAPQTQVSLNDLCPTNVTEHTIQAPGAFHPAKKAIVICVFWDQNTPISSVCKIVLLMVWLS